MKNSFILTSLLTLGTIGFLTTPNQPLALGEDIQYSYYKDSNDTFGSKLDSIENFKNEQVNIYKHDIKESLEVVTVEKEKQEKLLLSIDSISNSIDTNINVKDTLIKKQTWIKKLKYGK